MDKRISKTTKNIEKAFLELRSDKPTEKITVKELCEKAEINKSTFYCHYTDIYDLSEKLEQRVVADALKKLINPECVFSRPQSFVELLYKAYSSQAELINTLFSGSRRNVFIYNMRTDIMKIIFDSYPQYKDDPAVNVLLCYVIDGSYHAFMETRHFGDEISLRAIGEITEKLADMFGKYE